MRVTQVRSDRGLHLGWLPRPLIELLSHEVSRNTCAIPLRLYRFRNLPSSQAHLAGIRRICGEQRPHCRLAPFANPEELNPDPAVRRRCFEANYWVARQLAE